MFFAMKIRHTKLTMLVLVSAAAFTSCVDDKYDLSDIDTTVRVNVDNLTIPVNLDEIMLSSILEESDQLKIVNGQYAISEDGTFESSEIRIGAVTVGSQTLNPTIVSLPFVPAALEAVGDAGYFDVVAPVETYKFSADDIPAEITAVDALGADLRFVFSFRLRGISDIASRVELRDLVLQLPKGLDLSETAGGVYDPSTGIIEIPVKAFSGETFEITLAASRADLEAMGAEFDYDTHSLRIAGDFCVRKASLVISRADLLPGAVPSTLQLTIGYDIPDFAVRTFSGRVKYDITGVDISDVDLSDLPDVLTQSGTDISIVNPCIYIGLENPLGAYGLSARTGMTITSWHGDNSDRYSIDNPYFVVSPGNEQGYSDYCLSPVAPQTSPDGYGAAVHVPFTSLSGVLSGDGMPGRLGITLDDPNVNDQPVIDLPLDANLGRVRGDYLFFAPVALCEGSRIVYSDVADGWSSEDLDCVTITDLHVRATLTSDLPIALDVMAYPIDKDGNKISGVDIRGAKLNAGNDPQEVDIYITGQIRGLDGIRYEAVATAGAQEDVLSPDMHIRVTNLRPTATGYYEKEL